MKTVNVLLLTVANIIQLFFYSWICQEIEEENLKVLRAAYDSHWYEGNTKDRLSLCFLMQACNRPRAFGVIVTSNLNTFIAVLKSAFSYFQFLSTMTT